ncbi:unnamed protein product [Phytomonas sp. EM1]|nr:unnamed protein product [Phytomonas sp. EM1]|eukprot:CCW61987.1 unnamed protein product [Phytomonas sp. isolate EM1]
MSTQVRKNRHYRPKCPTNDSNSELLGFGLPSSPIRRHPCSYQRPQRKRVLPKEISLIILLLAVRTASEISMRKHMLSLELIANSYNFPGHPSIDDAEESNVHFNSMPSGKYVSFTELYSDGILTSTMSRCSSSDVANDEDPDDQEEESEKSENILEAGEKLQDMVYAPTDNKLAAPGEQFASNEVVWENIFSYMTWQETFPMRGISRFHYVKTLPFVCLTRMPSSRLPAIFIPCREDLDADEAMVDHALRPRPEPWTCPRCGLFNSATGGWCGNDQCRATRPARGFRIFLGQLRRCGTVAMVRWLLRNVLNAPEGALRCVENHRNTTTGRGKGCAWPTLLDEPTALRLLHANHRMLFDAIGGVEGMWVASLGGESALKVECRGREEEPHRPKHLPRGTIVVELPAALAQSVDAASFPPPPTYDDSLKMHQPTLEQPLFDNKKGMLFIKPRVWRHDPYQCSILE